MISRADEKRAQALVLANIEAALSEMREYVLRELAAGRTPDRRMMVALANGLNQLAERYSVDLMRGEYGDMISEAMQEAVGEVSEIAGGITLAVGSDAIDAALYVAGEKIKGITLEGQRVVAEELLKSIVGGRSRRELADSIADRLQVADEDGDLGEIPRWRAELVARNELMSNYRSTEQAAAQEAGFKRFRMVGPDDDRTNDDVCSRYLGQEHTPEEWEQIGAEEGIDPAYPLLTWGFHVNCRHDWIPVAESLEV